MRIPIAALARTSALLLAGVLGACVTAAPGTGNYESAVPGLATLPAPERQMALDSLHAESVADEAGPRVGIRANFDNYDGSRRIDAIVRADDDAYIAVGNIDANGSLRIVYPVTPQSDGFVRGGTSYQLPSFFAGFTDAFSQRRYNDYSRLISIRSRRDSYDNGTGYVFVIASWRPMHFDRVADGTRWTSYELTNDEYLTDPREAVDELAAVVAGDNREAYSVEYAHYTSSNNGTYAAESYDRCSYASGGSFGYGTLGAGLWGSPYSSASLISSGFGWGPSYGYGSAYGYGSGYGYGSYYNTGTGCYNSYSSVFLVPYYIAGRPYTPYTTYPPYYQPRGSRLSPDSLHLPRHWHQPALRDTVGTAAAKGARVIAAGEATDLHGRTPMNGFTSTRPTIEQMIQRRTNPGEVRGRGDVGRRLSDPGAQDQPMRPRFETPRSASPREMQPRSGSASAGHIESRHAAPAPRAEPARVQPRMTPTRSEPAHIEPVHQSPPPRPAPPPPPAANTGHPDHH